VGKKQAGKIVMGRPIKIRRMPPEGRGSEGTY